MTTTWRALLVGAAVGALSVTLLAAPAAAKGSAVGGTGAQWFLNNAFTGTADTVFFHGDPGDEVYVGDWDGDGTDTLLVRRGNRFLVRDTNSFGPTDRAFSYGDPGDTVLVGDWDGDGTDTLAVRRGNTFHVKNSTTSGVADVVFSYGDRGDTVLVGDWDGDGTDTLVVRRGGQYFVKNDLRSGVAAYSFHYGDPGDDVLVGTWTAAQQGDTLGVRRGGTYFLRHSLTSGRADRVVGYGNPTDTAFVGDWDGDGIDTLGVRRPPGRHVWELGFGDGDLRLGVDMLPGTYRSAGSISGSCSWARLSGLGGTPGEVVVAGGGTWSIVTVSASDAGFTSRGCERWTPVDNSYVGPPQPHFRDGTFVVGGHIQAGTYRASGMGTSTCYWERVSGFSRTVESILDRQWDSPVVTIQPGDVGFHSSGCGSWTR